MEIAMREIKIERNDSGQRLDKFLQKYLKEASRGFLFKMLRKKNITLNGKRAEGREILSEGDTVSVFFSDETFEKFRGVHKERRYPTTNLDILYEDSEAALLNKPVGMLSQKAKESDVTLVEYFLGYLQQKGEWREGGSFTPAVCNRLDRNTSGVEPVRTAKNVGTFEETHDRQVLPDDCGGCGETAVHDTGIFM